MTGPAPRKPRPVRPPRPVPARDREDIDARDPLGRMALFSDIEPAPPATEHLVVECSSCLKETPVGPLDLLMSTLPFSLHLPLVKRYHSFMRCPACGRHAWVRVRYRR